MVFTLGRRERSLTVSLLIKEHGGLVLVPTKAFPQDRLFIGALVSAMDDLLGEDSFRPDAAMFLIRGSAAANEMPGAD